jgi:MerR family mercuric resistance operon transcriptional regulator
MPYTIARLAAAADVHVETVRYYQRRGLLPEPARSRGSIRRYSESDAEQLRFIKRAQAVGFTLEEVTSLLALRSRACCSVTRSLAVSKLEVIEQRIGELQRLRSELTAWIAGCDANATEASCPVIDQLNSPTRVAGTKGTA